MKEKLTKALRERFPDMRPLLAERYVGKYMAAVLPEIATQYMHMTSEDMFAGEMNFAADQVSQAAGRAKIDGKQHYIYALMQQDPNTSLVISRYIGNSITHRVSRVCINPNYKKEIMQELKSLTIECEPQHLKDLQANANLRVPVDSASLASYIQQTRQALSCTNNEAYEEKLTRNLQIANYLQDQIAHDSEGAHLNEYWEEIDSGRIHGHGLSLQRIPKEVRHAALGHCHHYDFKAASYALMTSLALQFAPSLHTAALQDYIRYRSAMRKRIAADVGISEEWMKSIFTSLGFGAELKDNPFHAIRKKLGQDKYHKLIANSEFMHIATQLEAVSDVILKFVGTGDFEWLGKHYTEVNAKDGKKRTPKQLLAWLYQCMHPVIPS